MNDSQGSKRVMALATLIFFLMGAASPAKGSHTPGAATPGSYAYALVTLSDGRTAEVTASREPTYVAAWVKIWDGPQQVCFSFVNQRHNESYDYAQFNHYANGASLRGRAEQCANTNVNVVWTSEQLPGADVQNEAQPAIGVGNYDGETFAKAHATSKLDAYSNAAATGSVGEASISTTEKASVGFRSQQSVRLGPSAYAPPSEAASYVYARMTLPDGRKADIYGRGAEIDWYDRTPYGWMVIAGQPPLHCWFDNELYKDSGVSVAMRATVGGGDSCPTGTSVEITWMWTKEKPHLTTTPPSDVRAGLEPCREWRCPYVSWRPGTFRTKLPANAHGTFGNRAMVQGEVGFISRGPGSIP